MAIDYDKALALDIPGIQYTYNEKDTILYALGIGFGDDPLNERQLAYVYENQLQAFPTMAVIQGFVSFRDLDLGIDYARIVHAGQELTIHKPLPVAATVFAKTTIREIIDRGQKGAMVYLDRAIYDTDGALLADVMMSVLCRADGGFGGPVTELPQPQAVPDRAPDTFCELTTTPQQALIYRLSGDVNPLHVDPEAARKAGFDKPILHGLATFGLVARGFVDASCAGDGGRLKSLAGRFSAPVFPGETVHVEVWKEEDCFSLRASVMQRNSIIFNNGRATIS
ncbi:MaoC-like dehydratase [Pusillimonas sp. T7-7]|uniref:MaoC/PaaZ C-terminal domain-containing protein n=1 Tax=Pusillimonas sp. (strain T7-7) TaxID=1007105 RepID=UPI0002084F5C|nr:MaoC/PaaZ C-terminal domain-containing protein [Pusillimonas sp. T7-7]AEC21216.1 MaoC-like dehydratase [Pusillimonas sp. T7-7]